MSEEMPALTSRKSYIAGMLTRRELYRHMSKERYEQKLYRLKRIKELAV
jgi:hypothetical protein